jgi:hypothetical protein
MAIASNVLQDSTAVIIALGTMLSALAAVLGVVLKILIELKRNTLVSTAAAVSAESTRRNLQEPQGSA